MSPASLLKGKRLLIFDFDGTLADTSPLHAEAFAQVLEPYRVTVDYQAVAGLKTADALEKLLADGSVVLSPGELAELCRAKQKRVRHLIREQLRPLPGVAQFLEWARPRYRLAMYSSGSAGTVGVSLEKLELSGVFEPLLCADHVTRSKPHPEGYLRLLELTGTPAGEALVFEDSDAGLAAASSAGLQAVDVRHPFQYNFSEALL